LSQIQYSTSTIEDSEKDIVMIDDNAS